MNLLLVTDDDMLDETHARLSGRRLHHLRTVLDVGQGGTLRAGRIGGRMGTATVLRIDHESATLSLSLTEEPPLPLPVELMLALPRPKVLSRVLSTITVMGVKSIILFNCWRVERSFWSSPRLSEDRVQAALIEGLEQGRDTVLPQIRFVKRFRPFVEDELPSLLAGRRAILAHPSPHPIPPRIGGEIVAAIGPEGGFIPTEVSMLESVGFETFSLGPRILHVEAAVPALLAKLG